jgi:citronellol/citronellal dehydrogenase
VLNLSPPLSVEEKWFAPHVAYTMAKFGMSLCVLGMAGEFRTAGIAFNALWPRTVIATAAVQNLLGGDAVIQGSRTPEIMADAAHAILTSPSRACTGNFFIDEDLLRSRGVTDFAKYQVVPGADLIPDFFV